MTTQALLTLADVSKGYWDGGAERQVIDRLSLSLDAGQSLTLWGPSGSGKSTLLNLIAGVVPVDSGELLLQPDPEHSRIRYGRESVAQTAALRRLHIGYVFQFFNLIPTLTVRENVRLSLTMAQREVLEEEALARLARLRLGHRLDAFPDELSGGEQQRAAIARALAPRPALLLADEPTGNLDAANAAEVLDALFGALEESRCALVIATHDAAVAERTDRRLELG
ncbi:MAG: ABC transporter ATP-binding protein [Pseudomonadota bacterium]